MSAFLQTSALSALALRLLVALCVLLSGSTAMAEPGAPKARAEALAVNALVRGIISYTRWPESIDRLRLCIVGETGYAEKLRQPVDWYIAEDKLEFVALEPKADVHWPSRCEVVYVSQLVEGERLRELIKALTGEAILSIGETEDFCSFGGMFCLEHSSADLRFSVNLDAISRSGLRVNPMVLRLSRQLLDKAQP